MKLIIGRSAGSGDWYIIERADHEHKGWMEQIEPGVEAYRWSGRFSDADVEGTRAEMVGIAVAIRLRSSVSYTRCAVAFEGGLVQFWSPRNSQTRGFCSLEEADALASQIEVLLYDEALP